MAEFYVRNPMSPGMCGEDVRYFQEGLRHMGYENVPDDGVFGAETEAAYREMTIKNRLREYDNPPSEEIRSVLAGLIEETFRTHHPDADDQSIQRWTKAYSPWEFDTREQYENYLNAPDSLPRDVPFGGESEFRDARSAKYRELLESADWSAANAFNDAVSAWDRRANPLREGDYRKTEEPPPGSDSCLIADRGGDADAKSAITELALYDEVRKRLPSEFDDRRAEEATLRGMQGGVRTPEKLEEVLVANDRIFVIGTMPGARGMVDLSQPSISAPEIDKQLAALSSNVEAELQPSKQRGFAYG